MNPIDVVVIGAGTAGLSAGYTTASKGYSTLIIGSIEGSNLFHKKKVSNYLGVPSTTSGPQILTTMVEQAKGEGAELSDDRIASFVSTPAGFVVTTEKGKEIFAKSIIVAMGDNPKKLDVTGGSFINEFSKKDESWHGKKVVVIGSGDDAVSKVSDLAEKAKEVVLLVRSNELKTSVKNQKKLMSFGDMVKVQYNSPVKSIQNDGTRATGVNLEGGQVIDADFVFSAIGRAANTSLFAEQLERTPEGYLKTKPDSFETSVSGIFAAGACIDKRYGQKQAVISTGEGMNAGFEVVDYLKSIKGSTT